MTDDSELGKLPSWITNNPDYSDQINLFHSINKNAPCLLSDEADAKYVREWFIENNGLCCYRFGWVDSLLMLSNLFLDDVSELPDNFKLWRQKPAKEKGRQLEAIDKLCGDLALALDESDLFGELRVKDLPGFSHRWKIRIDMLVGLPFSVGADDGFIDDEPVNSSDTNNLRLVDFISLIGDEVLRVRDIERLSRGKNRATEDVLQMKEFARDCLRILDEELVLKRRPLGLIARLVALRFGGYGVNESDVKDWLR